MWFKTSEAMVNLSTVQQIVIDGNEIVFCFVSGHKSNAKFENDVIAAIEFARLLKFISKCEAILAKGKADE